MNTPENCRIPPISTMSQSLEDYLETVYMLLKDGREACVHDVAAMLGVKMPSVVKAIRELKKLGLTDQEPYSSIRLTKRGSELATQILGRHTLLRRFLQKLGVSERNADADACRMEHVLSAETLDRIRIFTEREK